MSTSTDTPHRLTQGFCTSVEGTGKKQRFRDHAVGGLYLRVTPAGAKSFAIRYRKPDRKQGEMVVGKHPTMTLAQARHRAREALLQVADGADPAESKRAAQRVAMERTEGVLSKVAEGWLMSSRVQGLAATTQSNYRAHLQNWILPKLGQVPIRDVSRATVAKFVEDVSNEGSGSVSNAVRRTLSSMFSYAIERDLVSGNPVRDVKPVHKDRVRNRVLSDDELKALWKRTEEVIAEGVTGVGMSPVLGVAVRLAMLVPTRVSEMAGARWDEIDFDKAILTIPAERMKGDKPHEVPLAGVAMQTLVEWREESGAATPWVFPRKDLQGPLKRDVVGRACRRFAAQKKFKSFGPHDLRRTCATGLAGKIPTDIIERTLSHNVGGGKAIVHYDHHTYREEKRRALEAWEGILMEIVGVTDVSTDNVVELSERVTGG